MGRLIPMSHLALIRRLTPDQPAVRSSESGLNEVDIHSFRLTLLPTPRRWPAHHPTQEWGGNCWDMPTGPSQSTHRRARLTGTRLYRPHRPTIADAARPNICRSGRPSPFPTGRTVEPDIRLPQCPRLSVGGSPGFHPTFLNQMPAYSRSVPPNAVRLLWAATLTKACGVAALGHCPT